jgi:oligopeptide transport system substrate-binding protein
VESVTGLGELPAYAWIPPGIAHYDSQRFSWVALGADARVAEARRLYGAAGYSPARPLALELRYPASPTHERIALAVSAMWHDVLGVDVRLAGEEFKSMLQSINRGEVQMFASSWVGDYNDPWTFAEVLKGDFGINLTRYHSDAYDAALARAALAADDHERRQSLELAERQLLEDVPLIPLYFYVNKHLVASRVSGWSDNVMNVVYSKDLAIKP